MINRSYPNEWRVERPEAVVGKIAQLRSAERPAMLEIMAQKGPRSDLGRPKTSPIENKRAFIQFLPD